MADLQKIPRHLAIILDGNGRWAKSRNLPRLMGHRAGLRKLEERFGGMGKSVYLCTKNGEGQ